MKKGPLEGIKVLDFSQVLSAPFCGMMLADMGADVIKIERPGAGDISREYGPYVNDISLYFCQYNRGKKGIAIDMRSEEGKKVVLDLVAQVDVVIENFKAGTLEKLGIGYDKMIEVNPGLIYGSISGFGTYGPLSHLPCMDIVDMLGEAETVTVRKDRTIIAGGAGDKAAITAEIEKLRRMLAEAKDEFAVDRARERLGKLAGGVAVIRVGAASELEMKEKKARVEDALNAVRAALAEGIVAGGGVALCSAIPAVREYAEQRTGDERVGAQIVMKALEEPIKQIAQNAGYDGNVVVSEALKQGNGIGLDALTGEYVSMVDAGIVDPVKVTRLALQNAASMAATFLTTEVDVIDPIDEAWLRSGGKTRKRPGTKH